MLQFTRYNDTNAKIAQARMLLEFGENLKNPDWSDGFAGFEKCLGFLCVVIIWSHSRYL